jgi:hypothetical protein
MYAKSEGGSCVQNSPLNLEESREEDAEESGEEVESSEEGAEQSGGEVPSSESDEEWDPLDEEDDVPGEDISFMTCYDTNCSFSRQLSERWCAARGRSSWV